MKERPILFSAPMVRALLDGSKTQTRRVVKLPRGAQIENDAPEWANFGDRPIWWPWIDASEDDDGFLPCPYGQPGDRLWVREAFSLCESTRSDGNRAPLYRATSIVGTEVKWKPSIHMPRWASRILLEITAVRVERLQDITEEDAWAEGCKRGIPNDVGGFFPAEEPDPSGIGRRGWDSARDWYADLWESINDPGSWDANPFVWVIEFRQIGGEA